MARNCQENCVKPWNGKLSATLKIRGGVQLTDLVKPQEVAETARTLDLNGGNPSCNHGGVLVLERRCYAVDCRNGTINECVNGTLQSKEQGYNTNSNNVVLVSSS